jgi:hypothetical protein
MAYLTTLAAFDPYTFGQIFGIGVSFVVFLFTTEKSEAPCF